MNFYIVVEGVTEKAVYKEWISYLNPSITYIDRIDQIHNNNFHIVSGYGYPNYFGVIEAAILDVNDRGNFDKLIIAVDSGDMTYEEKFSEISEFVSALDCIADIEIVIQYFCFETWALANRVIVRRNTPNVKLREYLNFFNVIQLDPELLPPYPKEQLNREKFAAKYLRKIINDRYSGITYNKNNPYPLLSEGYLNQVRKRHLETSHIDSFSVFLRVFAGYHPEPGDIQARLSG